MKSISARLLTGTAIVLAIFVLLTGLSVSYSVKQRAETALFDRLQGLVYGILGATEIEDEQRPVVNDLALPDQRLNQASSGLSAEVIGNGGIQLWESQSTSNPLPAVAYSPIGEWIFDSVNQPKNKNVHRMQMATVWELDSGEEISFIVHVVADADVLAGQLRRFDRTLWASLLASAVGLLLLQLLILNRSLQPLRHIGSELDEIEQGTRERLNEDVPTELKPLASSINLLLVSEKNRHEQYRHLLTDLAHSLKTPLSVLKNLGASRQNSQERHSLQDAHDSENMTRFKRPELSQSPTDEQILNQLDEQSPSDEHANKWTSTSQVINEQTDQMQNTVDRYLQRAAMRTPQYLSKPISPTPVINKLCASLSKIYHDPAPTFEIEIDELFQVRLADIDLYEVLGNVLDNACKYGARNIRITTDTSSRQITIDDDGPGFPSEYGRTLTDRGVRADTAIEGQGVGLAATMQLMHSYGGDLKLDSSPSSGARVILQFS